MRRGALLAILGAAACESKSPAREAPVPAPAPAPAPVPDAVDRDAAPAGVALVGAPGPAEADAVHGASGARVRRGTIALGGVPRAFWLRSAAEFDSPYTVIAIDLDGNGTAGPPVAATDTADERKAREWDDPEVTQLYEKTINLGAHSYELAVDPRGDTLRLTPLPTRQPDRAALRLGAAAPDFTLDDLDGQPFTLSALRGHPVLIDFWSTTCVECVTQAPQLAALYQRHHPRGLELLGIAGDTPDTLARFFASHPHVGRTALDDDTASARYRVGWWPSYFLVDAHGQLAVSRGSLDQIAAYLDAH